jgi:uncharacterized circularly permuted ATP-grasp superfamily protein
MSDNNEVFGPDKTVKAPYSKMIETINALGAKEIGKRWSAANRQVELDSFTFRLDPHKWRPVPIDWVPRLITQEEWSRIAAGVEQRLRAINRFLLELYCGKQEVVPKGVVYSSVNFNAGLQGVRPAKDVYAHIYGVDLVNLGDGKYVVLEDNLRIPSGISYQLKCTDIANGALPELKQMYDVMDYEIGSTYLRLFESLCDTPSPNCVILTDGSFGPAFFEHRYLSDVLGIPLVEGSDLFMHEDGTVRARTVDGSVKVDLIYRRVEDLELFVPGLTEAYRQGKVILVNAMGTGVADDKLVYLWVPEMIRHYLGQEPILPNAKAYNLMDPKTRQFALENIGNLVFKAREGYGGLGVYIMEDLDPAHRDDMSRRIMDRPFAFIAQEPLDFSKHVVFDRQSGGFQERYIDLRVYAVQDGEGKVTVFPGGLTRVARAKTRITNNSSGGSCKPTWVLK